ncbi:MAG: DUF460 domain-containing protein [Candidatus Nezhaarchaeota archaeon]|nr:DUF460 domain-containing protein [Candidatus Nezhaarchaeota archaeon]
MTEERLILGVDISAGSSPSSLAQPCYSLAILDGRGSVVRCAGRVKLRGLVKYAWRFKPAILAIDNVYELAESKARLLKLLRSLPPGIKIVQVTGHPRSARPLVEVAALRGLQAPSKPTPLQTAILCAKLALMGEGCEVKLLEPEVRIVVSRARSPGAGGMSQDRFKRDVASQVLQAVREVCESLKSRGIDYDLFLRGSKHRPEGALIVAYAPRGELRGVVSPYEGRGVKVKVYEPPSEDIAFVPREASYASSSRQGRYLIVGIDPGVVMGVAVLELGGRPLLLMSRRGLDRLRLSSLILSYGTPLIVASDVNPPPAFVERLSSSLNAVLYAPPSALSVDEKRKLALDFVEEHGLRVGDSHQRDALAAALKAFMHYRNKFEQVESHVKLVGAGVPVDEVKALVVRGLSIQEAIKRLSPQAPEPSAQLARPQLDSERLKEELRVLREKVVEQQRQIDSLELERASLLKSIKELSERLKEMEGCVERLRSEQALKARESLEVRRLESQLESSKAYALKLERRVRALEEELRSLAEVLLRWARGELRLLKPLSALTSSSIAEGVRELSLKHGDLVLVRDASSGSPEAVEALARLRVEGLVSLTSISPEARQALIKRQLAFLESPSLDILWAGGLAFAPSAKLNELLSESKRRVEEEGGELAEKSLRDILAKYKLSRSRALANGHSTVS